MMLLLENLKMSKALDSQVQEKLSSLSSEEINILQSISNGNNTHHPIDLCKFLEDQGFIYSLGNIKVYSHEGQSIYAPFWQLKPYMAFQFVLFVGGYAE